MTLNDTTNMSLEFAVLALEGDPGLATLWSHLAGGTWEQDAAGWQAAIRHHSNRHADPGVYYLATLRDAVQRMPSTTGDAAKQALVNEAFQCAGWRMREGEPCAEAVALIEVCLHLVIEGCSPGNASWAVEILDRALDLPLDEATRRERLPQLVRAVLRNCGMELRRPASLPVVWRLLAWMGTHAMYVELPQTLRCLIAALQRPANGHMHERPYWGIVEAALSEPGVGSGLAVDVAIGMLRANADSSEHIFFPLREAADLRRTHEALRSALFRGEFDFGPLEPQSQRRGAPGQIDLNPPPTAAAAWRQLLGSGGPLVELGAMPIRTAAIGLSVISFDTSRRNPSDEPAPPERESCQRWTVMLVRAYLRALDVSNRGLDAPLVAGLSLLEWRPWLAGCVAEAILAEAQEVGGAGYDSVKMLSSRIDVRRAEAAHALRLAIGRRSGGQMASDERWRRRWPDVERQLLRILAADFHRPIAGIDVPQLFAGVRQVRACALSDEDKVRVDRDVLCVDDSYLRYQLSEPMDEDQELVARCVLYVVHEAIHMAQGIAKKSTVTALRRTGGEQTLLHLDLGADHAACCIVAAAVPHWSLQWLKEVQSVALADFPATSAHTAAARERKSARVVAIRAELLARRRGLAIHAERGHVFVEFSRGGGSALLMQHGPPMRAIVEGPLTTADARTLDGAADLDACGPGAGEREAASRARVTVEAIDAVLERWLREGLNCSKSISADADASP